MAFYPTTFQDGQGGCNLGTSLNPDSIVLPLFIAGVCSGRPPRSVQFSVSGGHEYSGRSPRSVQFSLGGSALAA